MRPLAKFASLSPGEKTLLIQACFALASARIGLWVMPWGRLRRRLDRRVESGSARPDGSHSPERIVWAVRIASNYVTPRRSCLPRAVATKYLLGRNGHDADLVIGVAHNAFGKLRAHAWVEKEGTVLIGEEERDSFTALEDSQRPGQARRS